MDLCPPVAILHRQISTYTPARITETTSDRWQGSRYKQIVASLESLEASLYACSTLRAQNSQKADEHLGNPMRSNDWSAHRHKLLQAHETALLNYNCAIRAIDDFTDKQQYSKRSPDALAQERRELFEARQAMEGGMDRLRSPAQTVSELRSQFVQSPGTSLDVSRNSLEAFYGAHQPNRRPGNSGPRYSRSSNGEGSQGVRFHR
jgi:hypothetical protein